MSPGDGAPGEGEAWLFPGQGAQYVGMGRDLLARWPRARELFERAEALSGLPLRQLCMRGPAEQLRRPEVLEPALAALSMAHADRLHALRGPPRYVAGYSAGEVVALCLAGVLTEEDTLRVAVLRGRILQRAADSLTGRMVSIAGLPLPVLGALVADSGPPEALALAGLNAPDHGTVSGHPELVRTVEARVHALGAQVSEVDVSGPWHSPLVAHLVREVLDVLDSIRFLPPRLPLYSSVTGSREEEPWRLRVLLAEQVARPVRWHPLAAELLRRASTLLEVGPGHFLSGIVRRAAGTSHPREIRAVERPGGSLWPKSVLHG